MRRARGACFLNASAMISGVEATVPRHTILSISSITAIDVSFSDTSRPTYRLRSLRMDMGFVLRLALRGRSRYPPYDYAMSRPCDRAQPARADAVKVGRRDER